MHAIRSLPAESTDRVLALVAAAERVDGARALSEQAELALRHRHPATEHLGVLKGATVLGYVQVGPVRNGTAVVEGLVHPDHRRTGLGTALRNAAVAAAPGADLLAWAHGGGEAARAFAAASGATRVRRLLQMRREIDSITVPGATLPAGVTIRPFRVGADEDRWLAANAEIFADHPEQGTMTRRDLDERMAESWFDPDGFLIAEDAAGEVLGFHWTKVHPGTRTSRPAGEVYVVGVTPTGQGHGLGRALMVAGLQHLASPAATPNGPVTEVLLYVEASNEPALAMYTGLRFSVAHVDEQYRLPAS